MRAAIKNNTDSAAAVGAGPAFLNAPARLPVTEASFTGSIAACWTVNPMPGGLDEDDERNASNKAFNCGRSTTTVITTKSNQLLRHIPSENHAISCSMITSSILEDPTAMDLQPHEVGMQHPV
jgi:hypothetical protein